jgi:opacity protein-like surface antigen
MQTSKIFLFISFLSILNFSTVLAQSETEDEFWKLSETQQLILIGVKGGFNSSSYGGDFQKGKRKTGFNSGVSFVYTSSKRLGINVDLYYAQKGAKFEPHNYTFNGSVTKATHYLDYIQMDVPISILFGSGKTKVKPFIGLSTSFLIKGKHEEENAIGESRSWDLTDDPRKIRDENDIPDIDVVTIKKSDVGGLIGIGVQQELGNNFLSVDLRYNFGASNIRDYRVPSFTNNFISINAIYYFTLSKL